VGYPFLACDENELIKSGSLILLFIYVGVVFPKVMDEGCFTKILKEELSSLDVMQKHL
jgi:hypothetical protein